MGRAIVGIATLELDTEGVDSQGQKRSVIQSLTRRVRQEFNASVAEIDDQNSLASAVVAIAVVGSDSRHINSQLSKIVTWIETNFRDADVVDHSIEIF
jgi:hypothetical protein